MNRPPRSWTPEQLRQYIEFRVIEESMRLHGIATDDQVQALVIFFSAQFEDRRERIEVLRWLLNRIEIDSTKDLTKAEASVLISWSHTPESVGECARVAQAILQGQQAERGEHQLDLFDDGADQTIRAIRGKIK